MPLGESTGKRGLRVGAMMRLASGLYVPASAGGVATPAPVLTSANYTQGDTAGGGMPIVFTGTDLLGATVNVDGTPVAPTGNTSTTVTFTLPAHAPGVVNITVTTAGGTSNALSFEYWSPASLVSLTGWWRVPYAGSPLTGVTGGALSEATNPPAIGNAARALGGFNTIDFDGTNDVLQSSTDWGSLVSGAAGSVFVLFNADTAAATAAAAYDDRPLVCDDNFGFNLGFSSGGICPAFYDGGWKPAVPSRVACSPGAWHLAKCRWSGGTLGWGVDSGAMTTTAVGALQTLAGNKLTLGRVQISGMARFDGRIAELITASSAIADADVTKIRNYCQQRYGETV